MTKFLLHIPLLIGLLLATPAWADFQAGYDASQRGDYETALAEFRPLAEQGDASPQYNLGVMYANGAGVPQNYVLAYMWANLAASTGSEKAGKNRDILARSMTPNQLAEAQKLAREWKPKGK